MCYSVCVEHASAVILKTEAIVLRIRPFSRTSHVVTWLSPVYGRVTTVVKGACRPKSAFLGQYDLFGTCELLFYRRDHDGVHAIRECTPLATRDALRRDWRCITTGSYLCDLASRVAQPGQEAAGLHAWLGTTLDAWCAQPVSGTAVLRFELELLRHAGLMPQLAACPICHTPAHPWLRFGLGSGRPLCAHGGATVAGEPTVTLHRDVAGHLQRLAAGQSGAEHGVADDLSLGSRRFLGIFMRFHLDIPAAPRRLAFELLETVPASLAEIRGERK